MPTYFANALPGGALIGRQFAGRPASVEEVQAALDTGAESAVGHAATAAVLTALLGRPVAERRVTLALGPGDVLYVAALRGPRLAEGQVLSAEEVAARGCDFLRVEVLA